MPKLDGKNIARVRRENLSAALDVLGLDFNSVVKAPDAEYGSHFHDGESECRSCAYIRNNMVGIVLPHGMTQMEAARRFATSGFGKLAPPER